MALLALPDDRWACGPRTVRVRPAGLRGPREGWRRLGSKARLVGREAAIQSGVEPIALPEPCLVVLIGAAGSGKSTLAARLFRPDQVLSSDAYRGLVSGDESNQRATRAAFAALDHELDRRLQAGLTTVVDATNVTRFARRALLRRARAAGVPAVAIVLDLAPELVHARNTARSGRVVPATAVARQLASLATTIAQDDLAREGFAAIHHLRTATAVHGIRVAARSTAVG